MTDIVRRELDALDLLMQDHREMESLFREFEYLRENRKNTVSVIANACTELRILDTLQTEIFYASVGEAAGDDDEELDGILEEADEMHGTLLELIGKVERAPADPVKREAAFVVLTEHVKRRVLDDETVLFPLVKKLQRLDLDSVTASMKKRRAELMNP